MMEKFDFFGQSVDYNEIVEIGIFVEGKRLLGLIPMSRSIPYIIINKGNSTYRLSAPPCNDNRLGEWVAISVLQIELFTDKKGKEIMQRDQYGEPESIGYSFH